MKQVNMTVSLVVNVPDDVDPDDLYLSMACEDFRVGTTDLDLVEEAEVLTFGTTQCEEVKDEGRS